MDITTLGIKIDLDEVKAAIKALEQLSKSAEKTEDSTDKVTNSFSKAARAIKNLEQANLAQEKTATQAAKTAAALAATQESAANQQAARLRAQVRLEEGLANQKSVTAKRIELLAAKEAQASALSQKYTAQASAAQQRADNFALNQQSLIQNRALTTQARISQGAERLALQQEKFEFQKAQAAERAARRSQSAWDNIKSGAQQFVGGAAAALGFAGIAGSALSIVQTADSMTLLDSRLKLATKSQEEFTRTQQALRDSSLKTGLGLEDQIKGYTQLERSTRAMGLSSQQLTFLTESFGKAAVVSGADTASYQSALTQLNQGFASGVIRGQEFNSVAEQAPAIMEALANGLRGSNKEFDDLEKKGYLGVAALRKMAGEGKLVNSVTIPALIEGLKETNKQFDQMPLTVQRATEKLSTAYKIWISDQNNAVAGTNSLANAIGSLATNFSTVASIVTTSAIAIAAVVGGKLISSLVAATKQTSLYRLATIGSVEQEILSLKSKTALTAATVAQTEADLAAVRAKTVSGIASKELVAAEIAHGRAMVANSAATASYEAAVARATTAQKGFNVALSAFGGWVGVAATAFLAVIAYWDDIDKAIQKAIKSKKYFQSLTTKDFIGQEGAQTLADAEKKLAEVQKKRQALSSQRNTQTLPPQLQNYVGGEAAARSIAQQSFAAQDRELMLEESALRKVINDAKQARAEEFAAMRKQEVLGGDVSSTVVGAGPKPDDKKVRGRSALSSSDNALATVKSIVDQLQRQRDELQNINVLKSTENEYDKKADEFAKKAKAALGDKSLKNKEVVSQQYLVLSAQYKIAANQKRENDALEERNKKQADFDALIEETSRKRERNAVFNAVDLTSDKTPAEISAERTTEAYTNTLGILKDIKKFEDDQRALKSGKSSSEISMAATSAVFSSSPLLNAEDASFQKQLDMVDQRQQLFVRESKEWQFYESLKTAILKEQTRQREAINLKSWNNMLAGAQAGTQGIMTLLDAFGEKQSSTYRTMFALNKAFSIAQATINAYSAISKGWATGTTVFDMFSNAALIATNVFPIVSQIASVDANFAKGAAFSGAVGAGSDVLTTPTMFPMSGGQVGRAGEVAGSPEAIMPLSRDANGRLGVTVNGGSASGGGVVQHNSIQVSITGGQTNEETASVVSRELLRTMETIAKNQIVQAKRPGGALA